jgi:hypothetical protein
MKRCRLLPIVFFLAGCGDTVDSLSQAYRNINNEVVDALMMVTDEPSARVANEKIVSTYAERIATLEARIGELKLNLGAHRFRDEFIRSESGVILLSEQKFNRARLALELDRLQKLGFQFQQEKPAFDPEKTSPNLCALARAETTALLREKLQVDIFMK